MKTALILLGDRPVRDIEKKDLYCLMEELSIPTVKPLTVRIRMSVVRAVLRWAEEHEFCNHISFPRLPKAEPQKFVPPTISELSLLWTVAPPHLQRVILLGSQCGVRIDPSEMFSLKWEHVDFIQKVLRVQGAKKNLSAQWREIPLQESTVCTLKEWHTHDICNGCNEWIIHYRGKPVKSIKTTWNKCLDRTGIQRHIRPYDLRHSFATELIAQGIDIGTVSKLMGHSSPTMVLTHYQYVMDKQKITAIESLPNICNVPKPMCPNQAGVTALAVTP